jgi:hypothetical protein
MAIKQEVNAPLIITIGAVAGFLFLIIVMGLQAWYLWAEQGELQAKYGGARNVELQAMLEQQAGRLASARFENGRASIPIEQAMDVIVQQKGALPSTRPAR